MGCDWDYGLNPSSVHAVVGFHYEAKGCETDFDHYQQDWQICCASLLEGCHSSSWFCCEASLSDHPSPGCGPSLVVNDWKATPQPNSQSAYWLLPLLAHQSVKKTVWKEWKFWKQCAHITMQTKEKTCSSDSCCETSFCGFCHGPLEFGTGNVIDCQQQQIVRAVTTSKANSSLFKNKNNQDNSLKTTCYSAVGCYGSCVQYAPAVHSGSTYPSNHLLCNLGPSGHHCHSCSSAQFLEEGPFQGIHGHLLDLEDPAFNRDTCRLALELNILSQ